MRAAVVPIALASAFWLPIVVALVTAEPAWLWLEVGAAGGLLLEALEQD